MRDTRPVCVCGFYLLTLCISTTGVHIRTHITTVKSAVQFSYYSGRITGSVRFVYLWWWWWFEHFHGDDELLLDDDVYLPFLPLCVGLLIKLMTFWRDDTREKDIFIDLYLLLSLSTHTYYERVSKHTATSAESRKIIKNERISYSSSSSLFSLVGLI